MNNNKPVNFPNNKTQAEKTAEAINSLAALSNAVPRMVQISADRYAELVKAETTLQNLVSACRNLPNFVIADIVHNILGLGTTEEENGGKEC